MITTFQTQPHLDTRIYFQSNSNQFTEEDIYPKIKKIQQFLAEHPRVHLKIIVHSNPTGSKTKNQALAKTRAQAVVKMLVKNDINPSRLKIIASLQSPPGVMANQPL